MPSANHNTSDPFADTPPLPSTDFNPQHISSTSPPIRAPTSRATTAPARRNVRQQQRCGPHMPPTFSRRLQADRTTNLGARSHHSEVLADSESEQDMLLGSTATSSCHRPVRRIRYGSPESKQSRSLRSKNHTHLGSGAGGGSQQTIEELDIVNRQADGNYLLGENGSCGTIGTLSAAFGYGVGQETEDDEEALLARQDSQYAEIARQYFVSGCKTDKRMDDEREQAQVASMMLRLREQVAGKLEGEKWLYEPVDRAHVGFA